MKETRAPAHDHRVSPAVFLSCLFLCAGLASSAEATNVLRGVEMYTNGARLSLDGPPHYTVSLLENPDRLVMDLHGTRHAAPQSDWSGSGAPLRGVRSLQRGTPAKPATRLVFDLAGPVRYWAAWNGVQLLVRLESEDGVKSSPAPGAPTRRFDGRLMDPLGVPMDGTFLLDFSCAGRGGAKTWSESLYVRVHDGLFSASLASPATSVKTCKTLRADTPAGVRWKVLGRTVLLK